MNMRVVGIVVATLTLAGAATAAAKTHAKPKPAATPAAAAAAAAPAGKPAAAPAPAAAGRGCPKGKEWIAVPAVTYKADNIGGTGPIASGDMNGDGNLDFVGGNPGRGAAVYLNKGDGTFTAKSYPWPDPSLANAIALADFDGDGKLDIVGYGNGADGHVSVMLDNGEGGFKKGVEVEYAGSSHGNIAVGDFNRDGAMDFALNGYPGIKVYLNAGKGKFSAGVGYAGEGVGLVTADFNGDGRLDLATYDAKHVYLWMGKAGGAFAKPVAIDLTEEHGATGDGLRTADFNGDGKPDIAAFGQSGYTSAVTILLNKGDGTFGEPISFKVAENGEASAMAAGDLNGDGKADLVVSNRKNVLVFLNDGTGKAFGDATPVSAAWPGGGNAYSGDLVIGDFKKNGVSGIVVMQGGNGETPSQAVVLHGGCD
jgi:hypothetical protein